MKPILPRAPPIHRLITIPTLPVAFRQPEEHNRLRPEDYDQLPAPRHSPRGDLIVLKKPSSDLCDEKRPCSTFDGGICACCVFRVPVKEQDSNPIRRMQLKAL